MANPKILAFAGSMREGSFNKQLIKVAVEGAKAAGGEVTLIDLRDYQLPIMDLDVEKAGFPENARKLKDLFLANDGLLISTPEHNSSYPAFVKNTIDWVSRSTVPNEPSLSAFRNKVAALMSASPGALGGLRSLTNLRPLLTNSGILVLSSQVAVGRAHEAFDPQGNLKDAKHNDAIRKLGADLVAILRKLNA
jgi:chromate reductase